MSASVCNNLRLGKCKEGGFDYDGSIEVAIKKCLDRIKEMMGAVIVGGSSMSTESDSKWVPPKFCRRREYEESVSPEIFVASESDGNCQFPPAHRHTIMLRDFPNRATLGLECFLTVAIMNAVD